MWHAKDVGHGAQSKQQRQRPCLHRPNFGQPANQGAPDHDPSSECYQAASMSRSRESGQELSHRLWVVGGGSRNVWGEDVLQGLACSPAEKRTRSKTQGDAACSEKEAFHEKGRGMEEMCWG